MLERCGRAHALEPCLILGTMPARVVGDIDDCVATCRTLGKQLGHTRDGLGAPVDDTVEIDEEEHGPMVAAVVGAEAEGSS